MTTHDTPADAQVDEHDDDTAAPRPPKLHHQLAETAGDRYRRRRNAARLRRAHRTARLVFALGDGGRIAACWLPCAAIALAFAAVYELPATPLLAAAAFPAAFAGRIVSERRPLEAYRAWRAEGT